MKNYKKLNFNKFIVKQFSKEKNSGDKIHNFYEFMEDNMKKYNPKLSDSKDDKIKDEKLLLNFVKCPMTEGDLELCEEGLKISHIIYPKRNGIYILVEEEALFKF